MGSSSIGSIDRGMRRRRRGAAASDRLLRSVRLRTTLLTSMRVFCTSFY